jgi:diguanylate cyclase (GGDEF)-like protein
VLIGNKKYKDRIKKLHKLISVNSIISSSLDRKVILKEILQQTTNLMCCERGSVFLVDDATNELYFEVVSDEKETDKISDIRIKKGQGIAGIVWQSGKPMIINNAMKDQRHIKSVDDQLKYTTKSIIAIPLMGNGIVIGVMEAINKNENKNFDKFDYQLFVYLSIQASIAIKNANLYELATIDTKTQLFVHHFFESRLSEEFKRAIRFKRNLSLAMFDIDHFKMINDKFGHQAGDFILFKCAQIIKENCRELDIPSRYGGEEFVVILPETNKNGAFIFAERVRKKIDCETFEYDNHKIKFSISGGIAEVKEDSIKNYIDLIKASDFAMYKSKKNGRNLITANDSVCFDGGVNC